MMDVCKSTVEWIAEELGLLWKSGDFQIMQKPFSGFLYAHKFVTASHKKLEW